MIFPDLDIDELLDAQIICRLWHATRDAVERANLQRFNPCNIDPQTRRAIQTIDPDTYHEMFTELRQSSAV